MTLWAPIPPIQRAQTPFFINSKARPIWTHSRLTVFSTTRRVGTLKKTELPKVEMWTTLDKDVFHSILGSVFFQLFTNPSYLENIRTEPITFNKSMSSHTSFASYCVVLVDHWLDPIVPRIAVPGISHHQELSIIHHLNRETVWNLKSSCVSTRRAKYGKIAHLTILESSSLSKPK